MVSLQRRQVMMAGLGSMIAPAAVFAVPQNQNRLIVSGRILGADGRPLAGAAIAAGGARATADADGRFMLVATTRRYRVTSGGRSAEGVVSNQRRDAEGTWRATFSLTL